MGKVNPHSVTKSEVGLGNVTNNLGYVWRFEISFPCKHREGFMINRGPFTAEVHDPSLRSLCFRYTDSLSHFPEPGSKLKKYLSGGWSSGMFSDKHLHLWMPNVHVLKELYEAGFRLKLYSVPTDHIIKDETQCAINLNNAICVKEYTLDESIELINKSYEEYVDVFYA